MVERQKENLACPECNGRGIVIHPLWDEFYKNYDYSSGNIKKSVAEYWAELGTGNIPDEETDCQRCNGEGGLLVFFAD